MNRCVFGFFLAVLWPSVFLSGAEEPSPGTAPTQSVVPAASEKANPGVDSAVLKAQEEVRDPFSMTLPPEPETPAGVSPPAAPEIPVELQGIGFGSKDAYAVIGGDVFYNGDNKKGIKLLEVRRREVDVIVSGAKITIPLFPDLDLQKAKDRAQKKNAAKNISVNKKPEARSSLSGREQPRQ